MKITHLGLIDKETLKEAIEQKNFVGDSNRNDIDEMEQRNVNDTNSMSNQEVIEQKNVDGDSNRNDIDEKEQRNVNDTSSMSNQEIHNLLQKEVNRIKEDKTTEKPKKDRKVNMEKETNSKEKEYINEKKKQNYPESYQKEISYEGSL